jgi:hypothetical protein
MLLVGIAIDFTLLSQARSQSAFAAQAAATQAVRVAASTYALEVQNGSSPAVAVAHAIAAANSAGDLWWGAELGPLSQGYVSYEQTKTTSTNSNSSPPNFTAAVAYNVTYPPIFDPLFGQPNTKWIYASSATATAQFAYAQILMMLDTSNSMLIGARQSDIQTMETSAVCPPNNTLAANEFASTVKLSYNSGSDNDYNFAPGDNTWIGFTPSDSPHALHYNKNSTATGTEPADSLTPGGKSPYQLTGPCDRHQNFTSRPVRARAFRGGGAARRCSTLRHRNRDLGHAFHRSCCQSNIRGGLPIQFGHRPNRPRQYRKW